MGFFSKLFKGPEIDMEKSDANAKKMRALFHQAVGGGEDYRLIFGYTEDVSRFNYGFVHGSKTKIGNLLVGWNEESQTIVVVPTVPDLSGCGEPVYYRRSEILKAYRNKYPTDAFIIYGPGDRGRQAALAPGLVRGAFEAAGAGGPPCGNRPGALLHRLP